MIFHVVEFRDRVFVSPVFWWVATGVQITGCHSSQHGGSKTSNILGHTIKIFLSNRLKYFQIQEEGRMVSVSDAKNSLGVTALLEDFQINKMKMENKLKLVKMRREGRQSHRLQATYCDWSASVWVVIFI